MVLVQQPNVGYQRYIFDRGQLEYPGPPGGSYMRTNSVPLPANSEGSHFLLLRVDYNNGVSETDENNNVLALAVTNLPDLRPLALQLTNTAVSGEALGLIITVTNQGTGIAAGIWSDSVYLSTNAIWDVSDASLGGYT